MNPRQHPRPLRVGIVGCGNVLGAYRAALDPLCLAGETLVTVACGREHQRDAALAALRTPRFVTDPAEVLASPEVDVVLILTSMGHHAAMARAALEAGKHVLLEKPLATRLDEASDLVTLAAQSPGHLVCAPFTLLSPTFQRMARHLRAGDIGRPCLARARYGWAGPWWSEWFYRPGGGCLFDLGVYCVTTLTGLLGPVRRVMAMTGVAIPTRDIQGRTVQVEAEDNAQVLLDFGAGLFAVVTTGFTIQQYRSPALEVYGTTGTIQMLGDDWDPDGFELWKNEVGAWQVFKESHPEWPWTDGLRHLVDCLRTGRRPLATAEHARHVLEVLLAAQASGRDGQARTVSSTFSLPDAEPGGDTGPEAAHPAHLVHDRGRVP